MNAWILGSTLLLVAIGSWTDLRTMRIPNWLTGGFALAGLVFHGAWAGWPGAKAALVGGAVVMFPLLLFYRLGGMGAGDLKWFGAFGIWTGAVTALQLLLWALLIAGTMALFLLALRFRPLRRWGQRLPWPWGRHPTAPGRGAAFPFMLAVAPGYCWLLWQMQIWN
jgi:prepilin peptidase CpaA